MQTWQLGHCGMLSPGNTSTSDRQCVQAPTSGPAAIADSACRIHADSGIPCAAAAAS